MLLSTFVIDGHLKWDIALWLCFFAGQCGYILKRCAMAIRSTTNPIKSRRAFLYANWDILMFRTLIEFIFPFYFVRHADISAVASYFNFTLPSWAPEHMNVGAVGFIALGVAADVILDWAGQSDKVPSVIRVFIKENVPNV